MLALVSFRCGPQDADQIPQLVQGLDARRPQFLGRLPGRLVGGGDAQGAGLQHHQADPVGDHVMHLTGQPGPLLRPGLFGQQVLFALGPFGPIAQ